MKRLLAIDYGAKYKSKRQMKFIARFPSLQTNFKYGKYLNDL